MRILVTGASGFIGRQTIAPLLQRGFEVHGTYTKTLANLDSRIQWHQCDLLQEGTADALCAEILPTHLLHLAWYVNPADYKTSTENEHWVVATIALLEAFRENGGVRAVLTGTCMEYDWSKDTEYLREDSPTASLNPYSLAKNTTRESATRYAEKAGLSLAWGRIFNLYGPYEGKERLVSQTIAAISRGEAPRVRRGVTLDYSYVADIADAFAALVQSPVEGSVNIASGNPVTLEVIAETVAEIMASDIRPADFDSDDVPERVVADVTRLSSEVGWKPRHTLRQGLGETVRWWRTTTKTSS